MARMPPTSRPDPFPVIGRLIRGLAILLLFLAAGEWIASRGELRIPGNVLGMMLLAAALLTGLVKLAWVEETADALLSRLGLFFVPPGVGVILYVDLVKREWLPLALGLVVSTVLVILLTAASARLLMRFRDHAKEHLHQSTGEEC